MNSSKYACVQVQSLTMIPFYFAASTRESQENSYTQEHTHTRTTIISIDHPLPLCSLIIKIHKNNPENAIFSVNLSRSFLSATNLTHLFDIKYNTFSEGKAISQDTKLSQ